MAILILNVIRYKNVTQLESHYLVNFRHMCLKRFFYLFQKYQIQ